MSCLGYCGGGGDGDMNGYCVSCCGIGDIGVSSVCVGWGCMSCCDGNMNGSCVVCWGIGDIDVDGVCVE